MFFLWGGGLVITLDLGYCTILYHNVSAEWYSHLIFVFTSYKSLKKETKKKNWNNCQFDLKIGHFAWSTNRSSINVSHYVITVSEYRTNWRYFIRFQSITYFGVQFLVHNWSLDPHGISYGLIKLHTITLPTLFINVRKYYMQIEVESASYIRFFRLFNVIVSASMVRSFMSKYSYV